MLTKCFWNLDVDHLRNLDADIEFMTLVDRKITGFLRWQKICETLMLTKSWCNLDVGREFMNLECWQEVCDTWMVTESLWKQIFNFELMPVNLKFQDWRNVICSKNVIFSLCNTKFCIPNNNKWMKSMFLFNLKCFWGLN